ncbi:MAG TPA: YbhB/YbcL family Raf kinase inhibitor-like protein [Steroidobacteraceae bacterium]|nr:YbhB/YbcL family Raf kinase inhibitor-like protein [Steroidobacteraceae bacterium]
MAFSIRSSAFSDGQRIPPRYSRDGGNISPHLEWSDAPAGTKSYVLVVEDPDAPHGTFRHWAAYDIPAQSHALPEGAGSAQGAVPVKMAVNDFGNHQYDGPQPPLGHDAHHYYFRLAALDVANLSVPPHARVAEVWKAARAHTIAAAEMVGTFRRTQ